MFGLTKREQRWKAEQLAAETLAGVVKAALHAKAQVAASEVHEEELEALRSENARLRADVAKLQSLAEGFEKACNSAIGKSGILANANRYVWVRAMLSVEDIERLVNEQWPWCGTDPRKLAEIDATVDKFMKG